MFQQSVFGSLGDAKVQVRSFDSLTTDEWRVREQKLRDAAAADRKAARASGLFWGGLVGGFVATVVLLAFDYRKQG